MSRWAFWRSDRKASATRWVVLDVEATGLVQTGSRIKYRLMLGGSPAQLESWRKAVWDSLQAGQRIEDVRDARPEIRSALERAEKFLGLASLLSIVLAAVAVALAARRYAQRHLDHCAMLRCLGASRRATDSDMSAPMSRAHSSSRRSVCPRCL